MMEVVNALRSGFTFMIVVVLVVGLASVVDSIAGTLRRHVVHVECSHVCPCATDTDDDADDVVDTVKRP